MKTFRIFAAVLFSSILFFACETSQEDVPENILNAFNSEYPDAMDVEWEKESDGYEVEFEIDDVEREITYDMQGNIIETGIDVSEDELPQNTLSYISENYAGYEIDDADEVENNGVTYFEVELENGDQEIDLLFNMQGDFVREIERENTAM